MNKTKPAARPPAGAEPAGLPLVSPLCQAGPAGHVVPWTQHLRKWSRDKCSVTLPCWPFQAGEGPAGVSSRPLCCGLTLEWDGVQPTFGTPREASARSPWLH